MSRIRKVFRDAEELTLKSTEKGKYTSQGHRVRLVAELR